MVSLIKEAAMKKLSVIYILIFLSFISSTISPQQVDEKIRIGIFDSRCVALVYGGSGLFLTYIENLRKELTMNLRLGRRT